MTCPYELDDGAYILGALAPAERAEYERHLATCPACRDSIAQLAVLPGLLGRLDPATAQPPVAAPPSLLPRVLAAAKASRAAQRRRRVVGWVASGLVAAAVAAIVGVGVQIYDRDVPVGPTTSIVYNAMNLGDGGAPVEAEVGIQPAQTGTLVAIRCRYHDADQQKQWEIWLVVYPRDEMEGEPIGSWVAANDMPINVTAVTHYTPAEIGRIELQGSDHNMIAWWTPTG